MDMRGLDPAELKKGFIDFSALEKAMGMFLKMATGSVLTKSEVDHITSMVKGSPFEDGTAEKLERYNALAREKEQEEKAAAKARKAAARADKGRTERGRGAGAGHESAEARRERRRREREQRRRR